LHEPFTSPLVTFWIPRAVTAKLIGWNCEVVPT
jgi:hypothetical protein